MTYDGKNQVTLTRSILGQPYQLEDARGSFVEFSYLADGTKRYMVADASQHKPVFSNPYIDYGARYYDLTVARWQRPDPMADKYPDTSPYAFCANDPVNFVDPSGLSITMKGDSLAVSSYLNMLYLATGNYYDVDRDGNLSLTGSDNNFQGPRSNTLSDIIKLAIDSPTGFTLSMVYDDNDVFVDSYLNHTIDVRDLEIAGEAGVAFQATLIGHFLNEIQDPSEIFELAHNTSLAVEATIHSEMTGKKSKRRKEEFMALTDSSELVMFKYGRQRYIIENGTQSTTDTIILNGTPVPYSTRTRTGRLISVSKQ